MKCVLCGGTTTLNANQTIEVPLGIPGLKVAGANTYACTQCPEVYDELPPIPRLLSAVVCAIARLNRKLTTFERLFLSKQLGMPESSEFELMKQAAQEPVEANTFQIVFAPPVVLMRTSLVEEQEEEVAGRYFEVFNSRMEIPDGSPVVARYSVLPYYQELEQDLLHGRHATLLNTYREHQWIADARSWSSPGTLLEGLTPRTWDESDFYHLPEGAYVVKGITNSRKHQWNTRMFAPTKADVLLVANSLREDTLLSDQGLIAREYIPLRKIGEGLNGLPITNEWRTFWLATGPVGSRKAKLLAHGFYWASHPEALEEANFPPEAKSMAQAAADMVAEEATFFVLDLAETEVGGGGWTIIEINDGQMSGLSMIDPDLFYHNLIQALL